jgi:hypothetical protein
MWRSAILIVLLAVLSCHERINPYDPGSDNFATPPAVYVAHPVLGWFNQNGYLIGVRMRVDFVSVFPASLSILNVLNRDTEELAREIIQVGSGLDSYEVDLISNSVMDAGDYLVVLYWSEVSIGSCLFRVLRSSGSWVIHNVAEYDTMNIEF